MADMKSITATIHEWYKEGAGPSTIYAAMVEACEGVRGDCVATEDEVRRAWGEYGSDDCEIDDNVLASRGDGGLWVHAWVWIKDETEKRPDLVDESPSSRMTAEEYGAELRKLAPEIIAELRKIAPPGLLERKWTAEEADEAAATISSLAYVLRDWLPKEPNP